MQPYLEISLFSKFENPYSCYEMTDPVLKEEYQIKLHILWSDSGSGCLKALLKLFSRAHTNLFHASIYIIRFLSASQISLDWPMNLVYTIHCFQLHTCSDLYLRQMIISSPHSISYYWQLTIDNVHAPWADTVTSLGTSSQIFVSTWR